MNKRVSEIAKELGIPNNDLVALIHEGFPELGIKNHSNTISELYLDVVLDYVNKCLAEPPPPRNFVLRPKKIPALVPLSPLLRLAAPPPILRKSNKATALVMEESKKKLTNLTVFSPIVVRNLALLLNLRPFRLISELMEMGIFASIDQTIEENVAVRIAKKHDFALEILHPDQCQMTYLKIKNFKSLENLKFPPSGNSLGGFVCLIGLNGSGKTTLLQAIDFISQIIRGSLAAWIEDKCWDINDLTTALAGGYRTKNRNPVIQFSIGLKIDGKEYTWDACFNVKELKCIKEIIFSSTNEEDILLEVEEGNYTIRKNDNTQDGPNKIVFNYEGSILSTLSLDNVSPVVQELKNFLGNLRAFDTFAPQRIRSDSIDRSDEIGADGANLSNFLNTLKDEQKREFLGHLQKFYPHLQNWGLKPMKTKTGQDLKKIKISEEYDGKLETDAAHINDGMLRVMAIIAQALSSRSFLLFDEIENGVNPHIIEKLVDFLVEISKHKQIVVTTHNPIVLNYLDDETAKKSIILLYKTPQGHTRSCWYFDQPETRDKLSGLGPGEVYCDTDLEKMVKRLSDTKESE